MSDEVRKTGLDDDLWEHAQERLVEDASCRSAPRLGDPR